MLVFHPYYPDAAGCAETWRALLRFQLAGRAVLHLPTPAVHDYAAGLCRVWGWDTLLVVNQHAGERVPLTLKLAQELASCPELLCTVPYWRASGDWSHYLFLGDRNEPGIEGEEWADLAYFVVLKVQRQAQERITPAPSWHYDIMDVALSDRAQKAGIRFHLHWPAVPAGEGELCKSMPTTP